MRGVYRVQGHGADCVLKLYADTAEEIFQLAARAISASSRAKASTSARDARQARSLRLDARDLPMLLVDWINEMIGTSEIAGHPWGCVHAQLTHRQQRIELKATIVPLRGSWCSPLKAATLHDLRFEMHGNRWRASVVCDL